MNFINTTYQNQIQQTEQTPLLTRRSEQEELIAIIDEWVQRCFERNKAQTGSYIINAYHQSSHRLNFHNDQSLPDVFHLENFKNNVTIVHAERIKELPPSFKNLHNLRELKISEALSNDLCERTTLCFLDTIFMPLGCVALSLLSLTQLFSLCDNEARSDCCNAYGSILKDFKNNFCFDAKQLFDPYTLNLNVLINYPHLQSLILDLRSATEFPESIRSLTQLKLLEFSTRAPLTIPAWISELSQLQNLTIYNSRKSTNACLPESIGSLQHLKKLKFHDYPITFLPESLKNLVSLTELSLNNTLIHEIPQWISQLNSLTILSIRESPLHSIPSPLKNIILLRHLELSYSNISEIPEYFSELPLETLNLNCNPLNNVPETIKIPTLKKLYLSCTRISEVPEWIGSLRELNELDLSSNKLQTLPETIGNLPLLKHLTLSNNQLSSLPYSIGNLILLQSLELSDNLIREIPTTIGNLLELQNFDVSKNPTLHSLPLTIGNCSKLTHIHFYSTPIPYSQMTAIMTRARQLRDGDGIISLKARIESWVTYSGIGQTPQFLFDETLFSRQQQLDINEWLTRLEVTKEFQRDRDQLALLVCKILESLRPSEEPEAMEFKKAFFGHIDGNLVHCGDRAAMLLNLIYTDWQLLIINKNDSDNQKMQLLIGIAKTQTLRNVLQEFITEHQSESILGVVETYLYYETKLKNCLGLVTAVNSMLYADIGRISSLNEEDLIRKVESQYVNTLCNLDALDSILEKKVGFKEKKQAIVNSTQEEIEEIEAKEWEQSNAYLTALNSVKETRDREIVILRKKYL